MDGSTWECRRRSSWRATTLLHYSSRITSTLCHEACDRVKLTDELRVPSHRCIVLGTRNKRFCFGCCEERFKRSTLFGIKLRIGTLSQESVEPMLH